MKTVTSVLGLGMLLLSSVAASSGDGPIRILLLSGQNNHKWQETTPKIGAILSQSGGFAVDTIHEPALMTSVKLQEYDVLLSDWNTFGAATTTNWPLPVKKAFVEFIKSGKGFVVVHAGGSSFYDWPEYQQIAGVYWQNGQTSHGAPHRFQVEPVANHPVTAGLGSFYTTDELWVKPGVHTNATVVARAEGNALAVVTQLGKGRGFGLLLGHDAGFMETPEFAEFLVRGIRWAAVRSPQAK